MKFLIIYILKKLITLFFIIVPAFAFIGLLTQIIEKVKNIKKFDISDLLIYLIASLPEKIYYILSIAGVIAFFVVFRELILTRKIYPIFLNGISLRYLLIPVLIFSIVIFSFQIIDNLLLMPAGYKISKKYYKKLKGDQQVSESKYLFISNQWIKINDFTFVYFEFLDLNKYTGRNFIYLKLDQKSFYPIYRIESNLVEIKNNKMVLRNGKVVSLANIESFDYTKFKKIDFPEKIDIKNLKKLVKIKKPISILQFYQKAMIADKFGYPSGYFWSRFFSYLTSIFSPIVLLIFIYPWIWIKRREKYIVIFGSILIYWYTVSALASLAETGAVPYFSPLIINTLYTVIGLTLIFRIKFVEL